jgi:hypothetical protein
LEKRSIKQDRSGKRSGQLFGTEKKEKENFIERMVTKDLEDLLQHPEPNQRNA